MKCKSPLDVWQATRNIKVPVPCGQCMPCRINKRQSWLLRCLLESRYASTSSFWTLTFEDGSLGEASKKWTLYEFFRRIRSWEHQHGNTSPIRYFGCLDFGGTYGRPHYHLLIWNLRARYTEPEGYRSGLPRLRYHIPEWPYGHVDIGEFNLKTSRYVTRYIAEKNNVVPYRTQRPAIGFYGVQRLAVLFAKQCGIMPERPALLQIGGRVYPMDQWTRRRFADAYVGAGGRFDSWSLSKHALKTRMLKGFDEALPDFMKARMVKHEEEIERREAEADYRRAAAEAAASAILDARRRKAAV